MIKLQSFKTKSKRLKFMKTAFVCDSALQINKNFANNNPITVIPVEVRLDFTNEYTTDKNLAQANLQ